MTETLIRMKNEEESASRVSYGAKLEEKRSVVVVMAVVVVVKA